MFLDDYDSLILDSFRGQFDRIDSDDTPKDHAFVCQNFVTNRKQIQVRYGTLNSLTTGHPCVRQFEANFIIAGNPVSYIITCDGANNLYKTTTDGTNVTNTILTITGMVDFVGINFFNKLFILPVGPLNSTLYVWDGVNNIRSALGAAPTSSFTVTPAAGGNIPNGVHQFAVAFITQTGFTTQPGPKIAGVFTAVSVNFTGANGTADFTGIPLGPAGTTARVLFSTKAGLNTFYYIPGGQINDNTTTAINLSYFDTDLAVDASSLFDLRESIPSAPQVYGLAGMCSYHGRLFVFPGNTQYNPFVSDSGFPENFNSVTGFLDFNSFDTVVYAGFEYYGTLYLSSSQGTWSTQDNGGEPSSWNINLIDEDTSFPQHSLISTVSGRPRGPLSGLCLGITQEGLYIFNGVTQRPSLSWKIQGTWNRFTHGAYNAASLCVDIVRDIIYVLLPVDGSTSPNLLLAANCQNGVDPDNIEWSIFAFPFTPTSIALYAINDGNDFDYWLRIGKNPGIQKLTPNSTTDSGTAITAILQFGLLPEGPHDGSLTIYRYLRVRATGSGNLAISLTNEDGLSAYNPTALALSATPGQELDRQLNYTTERAQLTLTSTSGNCKIHKVALWFKKMWQMRPQ